MLMAGHFDLQPGNPGLAAALEVLPEPDVARFAEQRRQQIGLPDEIMWRLLDDMATVIAKTHGWSCATWWSHDLACPHGHKNRWQAAA